MRKKESKEGKDFPEIVFDEGSSSKKPGSTRSKRSKANGSSKSRAKGETIINFPPSDNETIKSEKFDDEKSSDGEGHKNNDYNEHDPKIVQNCFVFYYEKLNWLYQMTKTLLTYSRASLDKHEPEKKDGGWVKSVT